jgi:hypothetical protein
MPKMKGSTGRAEDLAQLNRALDQWIHMSKEQCAFRNSLSREYGISDDVLKQVEAEWHEGTERMAKMTRPFLKYFFRDNSGMSAEELQELALKLSPGGTHTGGWLADLIRNTECWTDPDPLLLAATMRLNWHGGKTGFQFLPDPAKTEHKHYQWQAADLIELLKTGTGGDPRRILTAEDRDFYNSLPERFTVYRGCAGVSADMAAAGVCWTTKRDVAEWFAWRAGSKGRLVMTTRVKKQDIAFAKASEFEIVVQPMKARQIKCRLHSARPKLSSWSKP